MQTSVKLQDSLSYSVWPVILFVIVLIAMILYFVYCYFKKNSAKDVEIKVVKPEKESLEKIKTRYLNKIDELKNKISENSIDIRGSYQELSFIIRMFVYEATGIKVQNYTLKDIEKIKMKELTNLIKEYYIPEFIEVPEGDVLSSLEKTRKVIEKWN